MLPAMNASTPPPIQAQRGSWRSIGSSGQSFIGCVVITGRSPITSAPCGGTKLKVSGASAALRCQSEKRMSVVEPSWSRKRHPRQAARIEAEVGVVELRVLVLRGQAQPDQTVMLALLGHLEVAVASA